MKLLFDQNISFRIIKKIEFAFPKARQIREVGLEDAADLDIWTYAKINFCIVTFDADFIDLSVLRGFPPKIIWLRIGNAVTKMIAEKILKEKKNILDFLANRELAILELD